MEKKFWRDTLKPYTQKSDAFALWQIASTIIPFMGIWFLYSKLLPLSIWVVIPLAFATSFFILRFFVLLHDCGHDSLFKSRKANKFFGYLMGVITGMPQYVWSKHHSYHHKTNGNWEKYHGPFNIISTEEYSKLSPSKQKSYWYWRHPLILIPGGFVYVLFNPRVNWMLGCIQLSFNILRTLVAKPSNTLDTIKKCESKYWKTPKEFRHMTYNNLTLLPIWALMCSAIGTYNFFIFYALTLTFSGGLGILFFTVQHNFEGSYGSDTERVDYFKAGLEGTSFLVLPKILNWFTADIGYHHIHHLSTSVPNYNLVRCHNDLEHLFKNVKRIEFSDIRHSLNYQLWDKDKELIVSMAEYKESMKSAAH
ncbi:fatty acid desaturase [Halobacteriovorax sp. HLS]|uniref:fatty acid desaturase family protein n=1 Tax=Halobacteriovorax sp. HLS TaxID=2234000 RepID=UPI000FDA1AD5|nr:fatty acid desaturase [Halobacteriovorax sp. HLS]